MKLWRLWLLGVVVSASVAQASDSIWGEWQASGTGCTEKTVDVLTNGGALSVIFRDLAIRIDKGQKPPFEKNRNCIFKINVEPPEGYILAGFQQLFSGGIIKGERSQVALDISYRLGNVKGEQSLLWPFGKTIRPEDPESSFYKTFADVNDKALCREKTMYTVHVRMRAQRKGKQTEVIAGIDSVDTEAGSDVRLIPQWKPCVARPVRR